MDDDKKENILENFFRPFNERAEQQKKKIKIVREMNNARARAILKPILDRIERDA